MACDMFLKIGDIKGESTDGVHKGEVEVLAWSWGVSQSGTMHVGTGGGAGKANFQDVSITKYVDRASPALWKHVATGSHVPEAVLVVRKAGGTPLEYIRITMKECLITSISTGGSGGEDRLTENISINFARVQLDYVPQKEDGSGDAEINMTYNIAKNQEALE